MNIVILDDYQDVVRKLPCASKLEAYPAKVYTNTVKGLGQLSVRLKDADIVVLIRERTHINRALLDKLPKLKLIAQTGKAGSHIDVQACTEKGIAIAEHVEAGERLAFCQMSLQAAKADLRRICAEIREELEPETLSMETAHALAASEAEAAPHPARRIAGAVYVSCSGRGGPHFGGDSAELQWVRHALGDVPLVGFFASGEIAHHHLYGYTGVLTVFTTPAEAT
jgi:hypothetical protein